jgi:putative membrane protein
MRNQRLNAGTAFTSDTISLRTFLKELPMTLEALLAYLHIAAILMVTVFLTSQAALLRIEWLNEAIVRRLARLDLIYGIAALVLLATGFARTWWGIKGFAWYWSQPLLHLKAGLFIAIGLMSIAPTLRYRRWVKAIEAGLGLPGAQAILSTRRIVMWEAHLLVLIPIAAVCLARGVGTR